MIASNEMKEEARTDIARFIEERVKAGRIAGSYPVGRSDGLNEREMIGEIQKNPFVQSVKPDLDEMTGNLKHIVFFLK